MNSENLTKARAELTRDEGERLTAYQDSVGLWTIGVGHLIDDGSGKPRVLKITHEESQAWLTMDMAIAYQRARKYVPEILYWADGPGEYGGNNSRARAILNMTFNLADRLAGFKNFLAAVNRHDWKTAADEMMDSKWAKQVGDRALRLRDMILTED